MRKRLIGVVAFTALGLLPYMGSSGQARDTYSQCMAKCTWGDFSCTESCAQSAYGRAGPVIRQSNGLAQPANSQQRGKTGLPPTTVNPALTNNPSLLGGSGAAGSISTTGSKAKLAPGGTNTQAR